MTARLFIHEEHPLRRPGIEHVTTDLRTELIDELVRFIRDEVAADDDVQLDAHTDLVMSGIVDSLGVVMIVETLEQRLDIRIDPVDVVIENFASVASMLDYLDSRDDCDLVSTG